jgi:D-tyrosyl-tRNA(Tyr) deacylase
MKIVLQRVSRATVFVKQRKSDGLGETPRRTLKGAIDGGFVLLIGVAHGDSETTAARLADKICGLRIFEDAAGKMNLDIKQSGGAILAISQFTLYADTSRGRRPSFIDAARPEEARMIYDKFVTYLRSQGLKVETGEFGADMDVELCNDGPVTILLEELPDK